MTALSWDGVDLSTVGDFEVLDVIRPILPSPRDVRIDVPGRAGSWLYVEEPGDRELIVDLAYIGTDFADKRTKIQDFASWIYSADAAKLIVDDEADRYWRARLSESPTPREIMTLAEFSVRWIVEPFALATVVSTQTDAQGGTPGVFGPAAFAGGGDVPTPPSIEVTAGASGMVGGFTLNVNGTELVYGSDLSALEVITLSSVSSLVFSAIGVDVELTGAFDPDDVDMRDISGDFGDVISGSGNSITVTPADSSTGASVSIDYRKRYLS